MDAPAAWTLIGYFRLGFAERESDRPELEGEGREDTPAAASSSAASGVATGRPGRRVGGGRAATAARPGHDPAASSSSAAAQVSNRLSQGTGGAIAK